MLNNLVSKTWAALKSGGEGLTKHLFVVMIVLGFAMLVLDAAEIPKSFSGKWFSESVATAIGSAWHLLTSAIITGGIFSVSLKSLQFMNVFRDEVSKLGTDPIISESAKALVREVVSHELEAAMMDPRFLENWVNTRKLWRQASQALFNNLFQEHRGDIESTMFDTYFPEDGSAYNVEQFRFKIEFDWHTDPGYLKSIEHSSYRLRPKNKNQEVRVRYRGDRPGDSRDDQDPSSVVISSLKVNGEELKDRKTERTETINGKSKVVTEYNIPVTGFEMYVVDREIVRIAPFRDVEEGTLRRITYRSFVRNLDVEVEYPDNLAVYLLISGSINEFEDVALALDHRIGYGRKCVKKSYKGMLFPGQGFVIHWAENKKGNENDRERN